MFKIFSFKIILVSICLFVISTATSSEGDRPGHDMTDPIPGEKIPPAPPLTVTQALDTFKLQEGFVLDNVAAEPYVFSPIATVFDGNGRMWVSEMTTFMPDVEGNGEEMPQGNIAVLADTNGDGKIDKRTVLLDDVILPRTVALVEGGIFYADLRQLYFAEVLPGDKLGVHEVVDPTYAEGGNVEHKTNTMLYHMDNWYYNAKSDKRYQTLPHSAPIPTGSTEIYRNKYWKLVRSKTEMRGQWGMSMDD